MGKALNGRWWLRRLVYGVALYLLLHSAPNPDWALLITVTFLAFSWIRSDTGPIKWNL